MCDLQSRAWPLVDNVNGTNEATAESCTVCEQCPTDTAGQLVAFDLSSDSTLLWDAASRSEIHAWGVTERAVGWTSGVARVCSTVGCST